MKTLYSVAALTLLFFSTGCSTTNINLSSAKSFVTGEKKESSKDSSNTEERQESEQQEPKQDEVATLANKLLEAIKPQFQEPIKPKKPTIPSPKNIVKGEFETTAAFEAKVEEERRKREQLIKNLEIDYNKKVATYNQDIIDAKKEYEKALVVHKKKIPSAIKSAMTIIYGKPLLQNLTYDADSERFYGEIVSEKEGKFSQKVAIPFPLESAKKFKESSTSITPEIVFDMSGKSLLLKEIRIPFQSKYYTAFLIEDSFTPKNIAVEIDGGTINTEALQTLTISQDSNTPLLGSIDYGVNEEIKKLQQRKLELEDEQRRSKLRVEKERELAEVRAELEKEIATLERKKIEGGEDDLPTLIANAKQAPINKNAYALIIGIQEYDEGVSPVHFADRSARNFKNAAKKLLGVSEENIILLENKEATSGRIKSSIGYLKTLVDEKSTIYFYFAGHGVPGRDKNAYLLPSDLSAKDIAFEKDLKVDTIYQNIASSKAQKVITILDSCFSGRDDEQNLLYEGVASVVLVKKQKEGEIPQKMTIFTAGASDEFANQYKERSNRLFSYYFIKALSEGKSSATEIADYTKENVTKIAKRLGRAYAQEPKIYGKIDIKLKGE